MKIVKIEYFVKVGEFACSDEFTNILEELKEAIISVTWSDSEKFVVRPVKKGNGVNPIKTNFVNHLKKKNWITERKISLVKGMNPGPIDAIKITSKAPFAVEWETGNISSSHRALNKIAIGIMQNQLIGGILVLPTKRLSQYLTDRIGNYEEIAPYFYLFENMNIQNGIIGVIAIEYDDVSLEALLIPKGKDGNAGK